MELKLPPTLEAQIARLALAIPRPRYSDTVRAMLLEHGLVTEEEVAELRGDQVSTLQAYRARGQMPSHYKWGSLICYHRDDIARLILDGQTVTAAAKRKRATKADLLGGNAA